MSPVRFLLNTTLPAPIIATLIMADMLRRRGLGVSPERFGGAAPRFQLGRDAQATLRICNEVRVRRGHLRAKLFAPRLEDRVKLLHALGLLFREVFRLADVIRQVVQLEPAVFEELDELPLSVTD